MKTFVTVTLRHSINARPSVVSVVAKAPMPKAVCWQMSLSWAWISSTECYHTGLPNWAFNVTGTGTRKLLSFCEDEELISPLANSPYLPSCRGSLFEICSNWCTRFSWAMTSRCYQNATERKPRTSKCYQKARERKPRIDNKTSKRNSTFSKQTDEVSSNERTVLFTKVGV